jgi:ectoine hydroxylase-related dioxygenase (phytanoyl-CoA dioxygenase family)
MPMDAAPDTLDAQLAALRPQFERDGAVCVRGAFSPEWLALLAEGIEANMAEPGPFAKEYTPAGQPGRFFGDYCNWRRIPQYREFLFHSPAARIVGTLMGSSKVNLFHEHVLVKEPHTAEKTPWHHDQPYWTVDGAQVCSLWMSLDPLPRASAVEYVAGSHRWGQWYTPKSFATANDHAAPGFVPVPDIDGNRDKYTLLGWDLEPGDCLVFHALTLHGAPGNAQAIRRRAVASRWTGHDARFVLRQGYMSPPPPPDAPPPGSPMDSDVFPVAWRAV